MNDRFVVTEDLYAGKGQRIANLIIDRIIFMGLFYGFIFLLVILYEEGSYMALWLENLSWIEDYLLTGILFGVLYFLSELLLKGRTIAKFITRTVVVDEQGKTPDALAILGRSFSRMIPFDAFSYLGATGRGWHDSLSKTYVVDVQEFERKKRLFGEFNQIGNSTEE
ncbi:RDD family protein [Zhouia spongiae]|uniref:RDD family protein n=1 Tax=Zhouia spongiae TaxID=2202721 RepID=A0ABY3YPR2_9FLAO|nr:RDD family protein [Zhouia spongiae]UNY99572.1 RDD family protein [Zhouia spongiae]